jgi:tetratricopeptide (TPR) repeat protein
MNGIIPVITLFAILILIPITCAETDEMTADEHYLMGNALSSFGQYENATKEYQLALKIRPGFTDALNNLGIVLNRLGRYEEALSVADDAVRFSPQDPDVWYNRG